MAGKPFLLSAAFLLVIHCKKEDIPKSPVSQDTIQQKKAVAAATKLQDHSAIETVKSFIAWYRDNEDNFSHFNTIKGGPEADEPAADYAIDFDQVDKEISFMKSSSFLSEKFLTTYRQNYVKGDVYFKNNPYNDGPPHSFDYDYFFKTQDDYQSDLRDIENLKFNLKQDNSQSASVEFHLKNVGMTYKYSLSKNKNNQWQIDSVENITK